MMSESKVGDVRDFRNFMGAVIDDRAFAKITGYIETARRAKTVVAGGGADSSRGYFIEPTLIEAKDPSDRTLCEEIFGPVVTAYVYDEQTWEETLALVDRTSPYALTGAVFAQDRAAVLQAAAALRNAA